ncbi:hypothetical protein FKM82_010110 [Ascaphus truei]
MLQRCAGRVPWLCHAVLTCSRHPPYGCLGSAGSFIAIACSTQVHVQRFVSWVETPGAGDPRERTAADTGDGQEGVETTDSPLCTKVSQPLHIRGRRAWGRSLSPLDRVSQMIPPEFVSQEVQDLRTPEAEFKLPGTEEDKDRVSEPPSEDEARLSYTHGSPLKPGDLVLAEFKRRHYTEFKNMFLLTDSGKLLSNWGAISHKEIVGKLPGLKLKTSCNFEFILRRPSLDDYVLLMKRGPTVSYPKLGLEPNQRSVAGKAPDRDSGDRTATRHPAAWDQVTGSRDMVHTHWYFINKDISDLPDMTSVAFDAVALDMLNPQVAFPAVLQNLKQGAVCAAYLANITQVIDVLEGIRSCQIPLICEKIIEVSLKDWLVAPSVRKDGSISQRVEPQWNADSEMKNLEQTEDTESDGMELDL